MTSSKLSKRKVRDSYIKDSEFFIQSKKFLKMHDAMIDGYKHKDFANYQYPDVYIDIHKE